MDKRLEKIRYFKANVKDFDSYINDRIRETKRENISESVESNSYEEYGLEPSEKLTADCLNYIVNNVYNFDRRYSIAIDKIGRFRIPLEHADSILFDEIVEMANEWKEKTGYEKEILTEDIEDIFG